jgi:hypothetical protein
MILVVFQLITVGGLFVCVVGISLSNLRIWP